MLELVLSAFPFVIAYCIGKYYQKINPKISQFIIGYILLFLIRTFSPLSAEAWQNDWITAIEKCHNKNWKEANELFNKSIEQYEKSNDNDHNYLYVDRARLKLILEDWSGALNDVNKAFEKGIKNNNEKVRAHLTRITANCYLGNHDQLNYDYEMVYELYDNKPLIEETDEYIIIRNLPDCSCFLEILTKYYIQIGKCKSQDDIKILLDSNMCIIKKNKKCACSCKKKINAETEFQNCVDWCDRVGTTAQVWCGTTFKALRCKAACAITVTELKKGCYWCCSGDGFYKNCVEPFEDICKYIKEPCDPAWD